MTKEQLDIRSIKENELESFSSVLAEAVSWLMNEGMGMWTAQQVAADKLLQNNQVHEMFMGHIRGEAAAVMILQEEDKYFCPEDSRDAAIYLHKLCIRRKYAKSGLSSEMIDWAKVYAKSRNKTYLRLDCAADRPKLCEFYEHSGFRKVKEQMLFGKYPTSFYEIELV